MKKMKYFHHCNFPLEFPTFLDENKNIRRQIPHLYVLLPTRLNATSCDMK